VGCRLDDNIVLDIGSFSMFGANSVVTKNVKPLHIVGGVPAKVIKVRGK
jgi:acetyltransferase-like isoleucine patch superfamily enzyme